MQHFTELLTTGSGYLDAAIAFLSAAATWLFAIIDWWKAQSKHIKLVVAVAVFLGVAIVLSLITGLLN